MNLVGGSRPHIPGFRDDGLGLQRETERCRQWPHARHTGYYAQVSVPYCSFLEANEWKFKTSR
jgi:hypothetical protein